MAAVLLGVDVDQSMPTAVSSSSSRYHRYSIQRVSHGRSRNTANRYVYKIKNNMKKNMHSRHNLAVAGCLLSTSILH